jgi:plexin A
MRFEFFGRGNGNGTARAEFSIVWWSDSSLISSRNSKKDGSLISVAREPSAEEKSAKITVGPGNKLDNSEDFHVVIYKCEQLASNCGLCLGLETSRFECGWCAADSHCTHSDSCQITTPLAWLSRLQRIPATLPPTICPFPRIDKFTPMKGPLHGKTKITITGINLGLTAEDIRNAVHVANVQCDAVDFEYTSSTRVVCNTRAPSVLRKQTQHVVIKLRDDPQYTAISNDTFTYVNPAVTSFRPHRGPKAGGTDITIFGEDLDSGYFFNVSIGNVPCLVKQRSGSMVVCRTGKSAVEGADFLVVNADGTQIKVDNVQFQYT